MLVPSPCHDQRASSKGDIAMDRRNQPNHSPPSMPLHNDGFASIDAASRCADRGNRAAMLEALRLGVISVTKDS